MHMVVKVHLTVSIVGSKCSCDIIRASFYVYVYSACFMGWFPTFRLCKGLYLFML